MIDYATTKCNFRHQSDIYGTLIASDMSPLSAVYRVKALSFNALTVSYMPGVNMMCALGVPGNMSHGPGPGLSGSPVDADVA